MTSNEWQKLTEDVTAEIAAKTARLAMMTHAKAAALTDAKKLLALENEESRLPAEIEALRRRLPLLAHELEDALKVEATERLREISQQAQATTTEVSASRAAIRLAMQSVLDCISQAHADWKAHGVIVAEAAYLSVRFGLAPLQIPRGARLSPEEQHRFKSQFDLLLRTTPNTQPWDRMRTEWQEARRREESQRQAAADKARPSNPHYIHFTDSLVQRGNDHAPAVAPDTRSGAALAAQPGASLALVAEKEKTAAALRDAIRQEQ